MSGILAAASGDGLFAWFPSATYDIDAQEAQSGSAIASFTLKSDGTIWKNEDDAGDTQLGTWLVNGPNTAFQVRGTVTSGPTNSGVTGGPTTATDITSDQTWTLSKTISGFSQCTWTIEILNKNTGAVLDSQAVTMMATIAF